MVLLHNTKQTDIFFIQGKTQPLFYYIYEKRRKKSYAPSINSEL